jgi:hypothetical protein
MPPSVKKGDNTGSTLSANAAVSKNGDNTGSTLSTNATVKTETILVAHYPQMLLSVKT